VIAYPLSRNQQRLITGNGSDNDLHVGGLSAINRRSAAIRPRARERDEARTSEAPFDGQPRYK